IRTGQRATFEITPQRLSRALLVSIFPLGGGKPSYDEATFGAVGVVRDLSELRAVEAVAREQREFLVKLIEHANDGIFALSPDGRFVWFNEQLIRQSGYTREELFSSDFRQFLPDADTKLAVDKFTRALGGEAQTFEMHGIRKSGESRLMLVTNTPIYDKGRVSSVLFIARDVTEERIAAERAAQADKLRALGQLASGVAHNFNNILAAILGHAQLIKRDFDDEKLIGRIDIIEKAAVDGAQTVKRIQGFALQQEEPVFDLVDLNQLVQDSANLTRARWVDDAQASGLPYQVDLDLEPLPLTLGTASELREVFVNIILNALDAMPQGGTLNISTEAKDSIVRIRFTDNGVGMSRPVRERIFEPFFTTKGTKGMGLGLAVSNTIVERHGGRIETRSNPGRGSSFTITFPVARTTFKKDQTVAGGEGGSVDILVIDDDRAVGEALAGMLVSAGHRAAQAASGREGLTMMESREFSIVFTDLAMPEMDGWAIASEIKRRWPATRVVLSTGYAISPEVIESHRDLVNAVVLKPIRFDELASTIAQVLS
ncbi:MAG TPA: ATP-binding protein, partial [Blastocatellia bacterium]|nr:ATP-binding protein [Blastocatellia bacterium]